MGRSHWLSLDDALSLGVSDREFYWFPWDRFSWLRQPSYSTPTSVKIRDSNRLIFRIRMVTNVFYEFTKTLNKGIKISLILYSQGIPIKLHNIYVLYPIINSRQKLSIWFKIKWIDHRFGLSTHGKRKEKCLNRTTKHYETVSSWLSPKARGKRTLTDSRVNCLYVTSKDRRNGVIENMNFRWRDYHVCYERF